MQHTHKKTGLFLGLLMAFATTLHTANAQVLPSRPLASVLDPSNPLSSNLVGLFEMNESSGTTDRNLVDGQTATFSGTSLPTWNTVDPSIALSGGTSLNSYLNAGTDLNFDQLTPNKMTVVAKVFVNALTQGGFAEKNDSNSIDSGFVFGMLSSGALQVEVEKNGADMSATTVAGAISAGQWVQVAFTWDGTVGTAAVTHIFVNGVEQTKTSVTDGSGSIGYSNATNSPFRIGNSTFGPYGSLNGKIAYLAVYKYRILTSSELNQLDSQFPVTTNAVVPVTEAGSPVTATTTSSGQSVQSPFQGWKGQIVAVQVTNNTLGPVTVNLLGPDGSSLATANSSAANFSLSAATLSATGTHDVVIQPSNPVTGSVSVSLSVQGARVPGSATDTSNPLSTNLVGLFIMGQGSGTTDRNLVDGQTATFSGTHLPTWNTTDPSITLSGGTSLNSYLNAGTDLNFDQLTPNKMTVVAKVFVNVLAQGGFAEKNDGNRIDSGFVFGMLGSGALQVQVEKSGADMSVTTAAGAISAGQWVQVAFTWDGTVGTAAAAHIFVNGVEQSKPSATDGAGTIGYSNATNNPFRIGSATFGTGGSLNGKIAYLAVYRGRILSATDLNALDSQLPINNSVVTQVSESGTGVTGTTTIAGQKLMFPFQGWTGQHVTVQLSNNTIGNVVASVLNSDGSLLTTATSSATNFNLPATILPATGTYTVSVQPTSGATGSITVSLQVPGARLGRSVLDDGSSLSTNLVGVFVMGEGSGTTDQNLVNGQTASFTGSSLPTWNTTDPSITFNGGTSLNSYLNAGTDSNFDKLTPNKMTVVAKVFINALAQGGFAEKNDGNSIDSGFVFGMLSSGALQALVEKSTINMSVTTAAGAISAGQWVQVAFTWDGTVGTAAAAHIFVNGVEQSKPSATDGAGTIGYSNATNNPFRIGSATFGIGGSLNGKIAYLAVYRGRILSAAELNTLDTQLPINNVDASGTIPSSGSLGINITSPGQNARLLLPANAGQNLVAWLFNNALGPLTVTLLNPDGTTLSTIDSSSVAFGPPAVFAPSTGTYAVYIRTNGSSTGSVNVTGIPPSTPTVSVSSPANGASVYLSAPPTLSANAISNNGVTVTKVEFFENQTLVGTATSSPYAVTLNSPTAGSHAYTAKVTDSNGMIGQSSPVSITWTNPQITGFSPSVGTVGTQVTLTGTGFGGSSVNNTVKFNGVAATSIVSWADSQIVAVIPQGASSGALQTVFYSSVSVTAPGTLTVANPVIASLSPPAGSNYGIVTINGSGFGSSPSLISGQVIFNGVNSSGIVSWSDSSITAQVPAGATTGPVTVSIYGFSSNGVQFTVEGAPVITSFTPATAGVGSSITINGSGFGAIQSNSLVQFYGANAIASSWTDTQIVASVPPGTATGPVNVVVAGVKSANFQFTVNNSVQVTDSLGHVTSYVATMLGGAWHPSFMMGGGCSSCTIRGALNRELDSVGKVLSNTDERQRKTFFTYDAAGNVTSNTIFLDPNTPVTTAYTYNSFGEPLTVTDPLGNVTTNTYDPNGNLLTVTSPKPDAPTAASITQFAYDLKGQLTQITDPLSHITTLAYYPTGLIQTITDAQSNVTSYEYDLRGNRTAVVDAQQNRTTFTYDLGDRLTKITYPDTTFSSFAYDSRGRRTSVTDQNGKVTSYAYDDADRLISITDAAQNVTTYAYDTENNLLSITDAAGHATSFTYDAFGRVTQKAFPSSLTENYVYDAIGNLTSKVDRKNQTILYVYDALNRLSHKTYPDATGVDYVYDLAGKIKQVSDPTGSYGFAYDNMGRLIGTTTQYSFLPGITYSNSYGYDAASNRTSFTAPDGSTNTYVYDTLNRLTTLTDSGAGQFTMGYDTLSRRIQLTRPNGITTSYGYDPVSHLQSVLHKLGVNTLDGATYSYDLAGNRTSKTNQLNSTVSNYGYNNIYQLTGVTQGAISTETYRFDPVGNRLSSLSVPSYSYNSSNEMTAAGSSSTYTYDSSGNTLTKTDGTGTTTYTWDFDNRLTSVHPAGQTTVTSKYDPFGRRIQKGGSVYVYDGANLIQEADGSGSMAARYVVGSGIDEPLAVYRNTTWKFYQADALGSITSLSTTAGAVSDSFEYDSFGNVTLTTGGFTQPFRYTGRELDVETGLYYYRARYYDPQSGRFLSEDPIAFEAGNDFYLYVHNNPINLRDPSGKNPNAATWPLVGPWVGLAGRGVITICFATGVCETIILGTAGVGVIALLEYGAIHAPPIEADWRKRPQFQCGKRRRQWNDEDCEEMYVMDRLACSAFPDAGDRAACYAQAAERYGNCLAGRPIPPLPWRRPN